MKISFIFRRFCGFREGGNYSLIKGRKIINGILNSASESYPWAQGWVASGVDPPSEVEVKHFQKDN